MNDPVRAQRSSAALPIGTGQDGNLLFRHEVDGELALLKIYRRRGSFPRELIKRASYYTLEGKRGVTARQRCATERACLVLWREHGFDVPALLDLPPPAEIPAGTCLWMEFRRGRLLAEQLGDESVATEEKCDTVKRLARTLGRRQALALELGEPRLAMEHATTKHVILSDEKLIHFDFEVVFAPHIEPLHALSQELGSLLRSLARYTTPADAEAVAEAFVQGHPSLSLLRRIAEFGVSGGGAHRRVKRVFDRWRRRGSLAKVDALHWILETLARREAEARS